MGALIVDFEIYERLIDFGSCTKGGIAGTPGLKVMNYILHLYSCCIEKGVSFDSAWKFENELNFA